jgi:hypothetical protein
MRIAQPGGSACRLDRAAAPRDELRSHGRHHLRGAVRSRCRPGASRGRDQEGIAVPTDRHACYAVEHSPRERRSTGGWARLTGNTDSRQRPAGSDRLYWNGVLGWLLVRRSRGGYHRSTRPSHSHAEWHRRSRPKRALRVRAWNCSSCPRQCQNAQARRTRSIIFSILAPP